MVEEEVEEEEEEEEESAAQTVVGTVDLMTTIHGKCSVLCVQIVRVAWKEMLNNENFLARQQGSSFPVSMPNSQVFTSLIFTGDTQGNIEVRVGYYSDPADFQLNELCHFEPTAAPAGTWIHVMCTLVHPGG